MTCFPANTIDVRTRDYASGIWTRAYIYDGSHKIVASVTLAESEAEVIAKCLIKSRARDLYESIVALGGSAQLMINGEIQEDPLNVSA